MKQPPRAEQVVAANVIEATWLRFRRLTSPTLCSNIIALRAPDLSEDRLKAKAEGVASAARSVIGYWHATAPTLNARVLTRYYAVLQASIADQVGSANPSYDLSEIQRHTEHGHGLSAHPDPDLDFPFNYFVVALNSGHFPSYAKSCQVNLSPYWFLKRPRDWAAEKSAIHARGISLAGLLLRVPELEMIAAECLGRPALSFPVGPSILRNADRLDLFNRKAPPIGSRTSYADIYVDPSVVSADFMRENGLPFRDYVVEHDQHSDTSHWVGAIDHPASQHMFEGLERYKSDYCGTCIVAPFWGARDVFILHLTILYALSIVVRYLPSLWHRVEHGDLDHVRVLIEHYLSIVDAVGPALALRRITGTELVVAMPGSMSAPI